MKNVLLLLKSYRQLFCLQSLSLQLQDTYRYMLGKKMSLCNISRMKLSGLLGTGARRTTTLLTTDRIEAKGQSSYHFGDKSFSELSNKC